MNAYDSYKSYPNVLNDGWHNVISVMSEAITSHKALVESNRIIKVVIQGKTIETDVAITNGRYYSPDLIIYFLEDIEAYNN